VVTGAFGDAIVRDLASASAHVGLVARRRGPLEDHAQIRPTQGVDRCLHGLALDRRSAGTVMVAAGK
jgi:NADP-dependent 3-hydroxy acid dehydrogenase YdfG